MFNWLEGFKDQLNLLIQALLFVATLVLIRVGWKQAKAADAQAKAADAQVAAANEQVATAKAQLSLSVKEMYANLSAADVATRPILHVVAEADYNNSNDGKFPDPSVLCEISGSGANMCGRGSKARGEVRTMRRVLHSRLQGQFGS